MGLEHTNWKKKLLFRSFAFRDEFCHPELTFSGDRLCDFGLVKKNPGIFTFQYGRRFNWACHDIALRLNSSRIYLSCSRFHYGRRAGRVKGADFMVMGDRHRG